MKTLSAILFFVLLGVGVAGAQQAPAPRAIAGTATTVLSERIIKNSPFSADAVNESVQVLADGNRIVRSSTNKLYRNSEGRFRQEISGGSGGGLSSLFTVGPGLTILDPVQGYRYRIDTELRTARVGALAPIAVAPGVARTLPAAPGAPAPAQRPSQDRYRQELEAAAAAAPIAAESAATIAQAQKSVAEALKAYRTEAELMQSTVVRAPLPMKKYESRTEELGTQSIEGVEAVGTRTITTIPAGDIGNERPIEIVYEKWYSNELQLVVMSKHNDPRFGEQTYRLTNIVRSEPDPSLFEVPAGFKVISEAGGRYRINTTAGSGQQNVVYTRSSGSGSATIVKTKP